MHNNIFKSIIIAVSFVVIFTVTIVTSIIIFGQAPSTNTLSSDTSNISVEEEIYHLYICDYDDSVLASYDFNVGDAIIDIVLPNNLTRTGYEFFGWDNDIPDIMQEEDLYIKALYIPIAYTINFESNGGSEVDSITSDFEATITAPSNPTRLGYTFAGWFSDIDLLNPFSFVTMPYLGITLYAKWNVNSYDLNFIGYGGVVVETTEYAYLSDLSEHILPTASRIGYAFNGWDQALPSVMPYNDLNIYATFTINQYTITFDSNNGSAVSPITQDYNSSIIAPSDPTRTGYTFAGWSPLVPSNMPVDGLTCVAEWTINQYTITFDSNNGSAVSPITQDYNSSIIAPSDPTRTGYTFNGWSPAIPSNMPVDGLTCVANWTINQYTITFDSNNGSAVSPITQDYNSSITAPSDPTRTGYTFNGWSPVIPSNMPVDGLTCVAQWTINQYTITFDSNFGSAVAPITQDYNSSIIAPDDPTWTGYTFAGWSPVIPSNMPVDGLTCVANWTINQYTITFDSNFGSAVSPITQDYNSVVVAPDDPTRTGYTFNGWSPLVPSNMPVDGLTCIAQWTINQYTITFDSNLGSAVPSITQDYNSSITAPANPTRVGYTFAGWSPVIPSNMPVDGLTCIAQWTINQYTITFDSNFGSEVPSITQDYNSSIIEPKDPFRIGYTFAGWSPLVPSNMPAENIICIAQWTINQYTITFDSNLGSEVPSITQDYNSSITAPSDPTRTGYTFAGWSPVIPSNMPVDGLTCVAQWTINQYTITFDSDNGSAVSPITQDYNSSIIAPSNPTRTGYTFDSWSPSVPSNMPAENITCIAQWTINQYTITFDSNSGSPLSPITQDYNSSITAPDDPTRTGYTFAGWSPVVPSNMPAENITCVAQWTINQYTITFDSNLGSAVSPITQDYNSSITAPSDPTRTGYTFAGWNPVVPSIMPAGNVTCIAQWTINQYTIDFDSNGGSEVSSITQNYSTVVTEPLDPTLDEYIFVMWCSDIGLTTEYIFSTMPAEDITLYALWDKIVEFEYEMVNLTDISITGLIISPYYLGNLNLAIPNTYDTFNVVGISEEAFLDSTRLLSITIPSSVLTIENRAFSGCINLTSILIPTSVTSIGTEILSGNGLLETLTIPYLGSDVDDSTGVIGEYFGTLTYDNGIAVDQNGTTYYLPIGLLTVNITNAKIIPNDAFYACEMITTITLNEGITSLGASAFLGSTGLTEITIPASVMEIMSFTFVGATGLTEINFNENSLLESIGSGAFAMTSALETFNIGVHVTSLGFMAFSESGVASVTFSNGINLTSIPSSTFESCINLTTIAIPNSVTSFGFDIFTGCSSLINLSIPFLGSNPSDSTGYLGELFSMTSYTGGVAVVQNGTTYYIPATLRSVSITNASLISANAFEGCNMLTTLTLNEGITSIGNFAFKDTTALTGILIPSTVLTIGNNAFEDSGISSLTFINNASVTTLGNYVFLNCINLTALSLPTSVTQIGTFILSGAYSITSLSIPFVGFTQVDSTGHIGKIFGSTAFSNTMQITIASVIYYIPLTLNSVSVTNALRIYSNAFYDCEVITSMTLNEGITSIDSYAFYDNSFTEIIIPSTVQTINAFSFNHCEELLSLTFADDYVITTISNNAFSYTGLTSFMFPSTLTTLGVSVLEYSAVSSVTFASGFSITTLGNYMFRNCVNLTSIEIPSSITTLGTTILAGDYSLTTITTPFMGANASSVTGHLGMLFGTTIYDNSTALNFGGSTSYYIPNGLRTVNLTNTLTFSANAFRGCSMLTSVTLNDGITTIAANAFDSCSGISSIIIPSTVTSIGNYAFNGCTSLSEITLSVGINLQTIGSYAFVSTAISTFTIPSTITTLGASAFQNSAISSVTFEAGSSLTSISDYMFRNCANLTSIIIPSSVTTLGTTILAGNYNLTSITIPFMGSNAGLTTGHLGRLFGTAYYENATGINFSGTVYYIPNGLASVTLTNTTYLASYAFTDCTMVTSVTLNEGITTIGASAFYNCSGISSITIPATVTSFGSNTFRGSTSLSEIVLTEGISLQTIGTYAFAFTAIPSFVIPATITLLGAGAFYGSAISSVTFEAGFSLTLIDDFMFRNCANLTSIEIPSSVTELGDTILAGDYSLTSISVPFMGINYNYSLGHLGQLFGKNIYDYSTPLRFGSSTDFYIPTGLRSVTLTNTLTLASYAFRDCSMLTSIVLNEGITLIGTYAFYGCTGISSIVIPSSVTSISSYVFSGATSLSEITLTEGINLSGIGAFAFQSTAISSFTIPSTITLLGAGAFYGSAISSVTFEAGYSYSVLEDHMFRFCVNLTSIEIPSCVSDIGTTIFAGDYNLTSITIPFMGSSSIDATGHLGKLFGTNIYDYSTPLRFGSSSTDFYIPTGLRSVTLTNTLTLASYAFRDCSMLTSIVLNEGITLIGTYAFYGCTGISSIVIPSSVTSISSYVFSGATSLSEITLTEGINLSGIGAFAFQSTAISSFTIPSTITLLGAGAFYGSAISSVTFEAGFSLTLIDDFMFRNCANLTSIEIPSSVTELGDTILAGDYSLTSISVPFMGINYNYSLGHLGQLFGTNIYDYSTPLRFGSSSTDFYIPTGLRSVTLTNTLTLASYAFRDCSMLTSITLNEGLGGISTSAFYNCSGISSIVIPSSVTSIGNDAFLGCIALATVTLNEGLTSIGSNAFNGCTSLLALRLPSTLNAVGLSCLANTPLLTTIIINSEAISNSATYLTYLSITSRTTVYVLSGLLVDSIITSNFTLGTSDIIGYDMWELN